MSEIWKFCSSILWTITIMVQYLLLHFMLFYVILLDVILLLAILFISLYTGDQKKGTTFWLHIKSSLFGLWTSTFPWSEIFKKWVMLRKHYFGALISVHSTHGKKTEKLQFSPNHLADFYHSLFFMKLGSLLNWNRKNIWTFSRK